MDLMDKILNQARNHLTCPICRSQYEEGELKLRGFIDNTYIFQAFCGKGHEPMIVTYLASLQRLEKPISAYFHVLSGKKITPETVSGANIELDRFDGNFREIFSHQKNKT